MVRYYQWPPHLLFSPTLFLRLSWQSSGQPPKSLPQTSLLLAELNHFLQFSNSLWGRSSNLEKARKPGEGRQSSGENWGTWLYKSRGWLGGSNVWMCANIGRLAWEDKQGLKGSSLEFWITTLLSSSHLRSLFSCDLEDLDPTGSSIN